MMGPRELENSIHDLNIHLHGLVAEARSFDTSAQTLKLREAEGELYRCQAELLSASVSAGRLRDNRDALWVALRDIVTVLDEGYQEGEPLRACLDRVHKVVDAARPLIKATD